MLKLFHRGIEITAERSDINFMVAPACPIFALGSFTVAGFALLIAGCAVYDNWYPMFVWIPVFLALFCSYMFVQSSDENGSCHGGFISNDSWLFYTVMFGTSTIALALVFWHLKIGNIGPLHIGGWLLTAVGFFVAMILQKKVDAGY